MTQLLQQAFSRLSSDLSEPEQDKLAQLMMKNLKTLHDLLLEQEERDDFERLALLEAQRGMENEIEYTLKDVKEVYQ